MPLPNNIQQQIEQESEAEMIYKPKYGGKDWSGHETIMKYEVNDERCECYEKGATKYAELWQQEKQRADRYEQALKGLHEKVKSAIFPHLPIENMGAQVCIEIDKMLTELNLLS